MVAERMTPEMVNSFWEKVSIDHTNVSRCWIWNAGKSRAGYGNIKLFGKTRFSHRVSYELVHGPIQDGYVLMHTCDNPPCVNPDHLRPGTVRDNTQDSIAKGRWMSGARRAAYKARKEETRRRKVAADPTLDLALWRDNPERATMDLAKYWDKMRQDAPRIDQEREDALIAQRSSHPSI